MGSPFAQLGSVTFLDCCGVSRVVLVFRLNLLI